MLPGGQTRPVTPRVCCGGGGSGAASLTVSPQNGDGGGRGGALVPVLPLPAVNTGWGGSPPIRSPLHEEGWKRGRAGWLAACREQEVGPLPTNVGWGEGCGEMAHSHLTTTVSQLPSLHCLLPTPISPPLSPHHHHPTPFSQLPYPHPHLPTLIGPLPSRNSHIYTHT